MSWLTSAAAVANATVNPFVRRENVIALGNSGTGKTHVALALGLAACQSTSGLLRLGIAAKSNVSKLFTAGKRAARRDVRSCAALGR